MMLRIAAITALVALAIGLAGCMGPNPEVVSHELRLPQQPGDPYIMIVTVANNGRGDGEIEVTARLRSPDSGQIVAEESKTAQIKGHETIDVAVELHPSTEGPFQETVEVTYPP
jgi:hypothetical protein